MNRLNIALALAATLTANSAFAADSGNSPMRFQLGFSAVSGMSDLKDKIEANNPRLQARTISPIGLSASLYRPLGDNWGLTGSFGPVVAATGDASFTIVPLGVGVRYDLARGESMSPYLRVGVEKAVVSGDLVQDGSAGGMLALGLDFGPPDRSGWGLELALRTLKVQVPGANAAATKSAQPYKASLTGYWAF